MHFLAIPFIASAPAASKIVANFLLSPIAQLRKADSRIWGDPTVLAMDRLPPDMKAGFAALPRGPATLSDADLGRTLLNHIKLGAAFGTTWSNAMPAAVSHHLAGKTPKTVAKRV